MGHSSNFEKENANRLHQLPSERWRIMCGLGRSRYHAGKFQDAKKYVAECLQLMPQAAAAACTRRQERAHVYAQRSSLPQGVWWHQATGSRGKPGVLCTMPQCGRGCFQYYSGLTSFQLSEWNEAAKSLQQAHNEKYNSPHGFLVWGMALYRLQNRKGARDVWKAALALTAPRTTPDETSQLHRNLLT